MFYVNSTVKNVLAGAMNRRGLIFNISGDSESNELRIRENLVKGCKEGMYLRGRGLVMKEES